MTKYIYTKKDVAKEAERLIGLFSQAEFTWMPKTYAMELCDQFIAEYQNEIIKHDQNESLKNRFKFWLDVKYHLHKNK